MIFISPGKSSPFLRASVVILLFLWLALPLRGSEDRSQLDGRVLPMDFAPIRAPQNTLRLPFWGSDSNSIQLMSILPEGTKVKRGDTIATFNFTSEDAKDYLDQQYARIKAQRDEKTLQLEKTVHELEESLEKARIQAEISRLNLARATTFSKIRLVILEFEARQQEFETKALEHKLKAARENLEKVSAITHNQLAVWESYFGIFTMTKKRYQVQSPDDGYLFYPHLEKKNRKIQVGDDLSSGVHFLSVVKSDRTELQFFLPEKSFSEVKIGDVATIILDGKDIPAEIFEIGFFPQRFGDVLNDYHVANAWEKCFIVRATIRQKLALGSNSNVRVRLKNGKSSL